jgi:Family of unknown function (DUF6492)
VHAEPRPDGVQRHASLSELTIVTVVFEAEYALLELQALSMAVFLDESVATEILVIDNSRRPMSKARKRRLLTSYGRLAPKVRFLRHEEVARVPATTGWRSQQVLKIQIADWITTDGYLVLDAKNHLIARADLSTFVAPDGRPKCNFQHYETHPLRSSLEIALDNFGLERTSYLARFTATVTPFILVTQACLDLIAYLEVAEQRPFAETFVEKAFTEFFLYSAWLEWSGTRLEKLYDDSGIANAVVWPRGRSSDAVAATLDDARERQARILSIHRTALARMDRGATSLIVDFWVERGLFASVGVARRFIDKYRLRYFSVMGMRKLRALS